MLDRSSPLELTHYAMFIHSVITDYCGLCAGWPSAAAEVPQLDSFVVRPGHYDSVTKLQARHAVRVITQRH